MIQYLCPFPCSVLNFRLALVLVTSTCLFVFCRLFTSLTFSVSRCCFCRFRPLLCCLFFPCFRRCFVAIQLCFQLCFDLLAQCLLRSLHRISRCQVAFLLARGISVFPPVDYFVFVPELSLFYFESDSFLTSL